MGPSCHVMPDSLIVLLRSEPEVAEVTVSGPGARRIPVFVSGTAFVESG